MPPDVCEVCGNPADHLIECATCGALMCIDCCYEVVDRLVCVDCAAEAELNDEP